MTSTQSKNNHNAFFIRYRQHIGSSLSFGLIIFAILSFTGISLIISDLSSIKNAAYSSMINDRPLTIDLYNIATDASYTYISIMIIMLALVLLVVAKCFDHLYKKSIVDLTYSLPVSKNQRFLASTAAGLTVIVGAVLLSVLILAIFHSAASSMNSDYAEALKNSKLKSFDVFNVYIQLSLIVLAYMLYFYGIAVFVFACCGELFDSVAYTIATAASVIVVVYIARAISEFYITDFVYKYSPTDYMIYLSPFYILGLGDFHDYISNDYNEYIADGFSKIYLPVFVIAAILLVLAFFIHRRRKAENVGIPFAFKPLYYVISSLVVFCLSEMIYMNLYEMLHYDNYDQYYYMGSVVASFVIMTLIFIVLEALAERKRKPTKKSVIQGAIRYVLTVAVTFVICLVVKEVTIKSAFIVPDKDEIEYVSIYCQVYKPSEEEKYDEYGNLITDDELLLSTRNYIELAYNKQEQIDDVYALVENMIAVQKEFYNEKGIFKTRWGWDDEELNKIEYTISLNITLNYEDGSSINYWERNYNDPLIEEWTKNYLLGDLYEEFMELKPYDENMGVYD